MHQGSRIMGQLLWGAPSPRYGQDLQAVASECAVDNVLAVACPIEPAICGPLIIEHLYGMRAISTDNPDATHSVAAIILNGNLFSVGRPRRPLRAANARRQWK